MVKGRVVNRGEQLRSLSVEVGEEKDPARISTEMPLLYKPEGAKYEKKLAELKTLHHSQCIFNRQPLLVPALRFWFDDNGVFHGTFTCNQNQQGYDNMVHGGIIASIIDASMAQCLMGHGVVAYTTDLAIRYRKPVFIGKTATLKTLIKAVNVGVLHTLQCEITQERHLAVSATGKFFKIE